MFQDWWSAHRLEVFLSGIGLLAVIVLAAVVFLYKCWEKK